MKKKIEVTAFTIDQKGIDKLKSKYFEECNEFIYFRKGEWTGILDSVSSAYNWISSNQDIVFLWISNTVNTLAALEYSRRLINWFDEKILDKIRKKYSKQEKCSISYDNQNARIARVICCKKNGSKEEKKAFNKLTKKWKKLLGEGSIAFIPQKQAGSFRYIVNEKGYALFSRINKNQLQGIEGTDTDTINLLKDMFEKEFYEIVLQNEIKLLKKL